MNPFYWLSLLGGTLIALQAAVNTRLAAGLGSPVVASLVSASITTVSLLLYCLLAKTTLPGSAAIAQTPWWAWLGGLVGAVFLTIVIICTQNLGVAAVMVLIVAAQMIASLLIDHFAVTGLPAHPFTVSRLIGVALIIGGVWLVERS